LANSSLTLQDKPTVCYHREDQLQQLDVTIAGAFKSLLKHFSVVGKCVLLSDTILAVLRTDNRMIKDDIGDVLTTHTVMHSGL
jgi:hypothetical protein